jgi:hypothetical protein
MITRVFLEIVNMSLTASYVILAVLLLRLLLRRFPASLSYALWLVVLLRLVLPFSSKAGSLIPSARTVSRLFQGLKQHRKPDPRSRPRGPHVLSLSPVGGRCRISLDMWLGVLAWICLTVSSPAPVAAIDGASLYRHVRFAIRIGDDLYSSDRLEPLCHRHLRPKNMACRPLERGSAIW